MKPSTIHLPNPDTEKPPYYTSITERLIQLDLATAESLPFFSIVRH